MKSAHKGKNEYFHNISESKDGVKIVGIGRVIKKTPYNAIFLFYSQLSGTPITYSLTGKDLNEYLFSNIYFGKVCEDNESLNNGLGYFMDTGVKRYLVCNHLLEEIDLSTMWGIKQVICGNPKEKELAIDIRETCKKLEVPFYFISQDSKDFNMGGCR